MINPSAVDIAGLFEGLDPARFVPGADPALPPRRNASPKPIRTYVDATGLTLSAISDRHFMAWIVASVMPLAGRRVLEVGTGTGYLAYALAQLVGDDGAVEGCEVIPALFEASVRNPLIASQPSIRLHGGDFVDVVPTLGQFDVVIATSAMSNLHGALVAACNPNGGLMALPVEIAGGGDCYTIFRREGASVRAIDAMLSISVPTTGGYSPDPAWSIPIRSLIPEFDAAKTMCIARSSDWDHPVYDTLAFRSFLQAHDPLFAAVSLTDDDQPFVQRVAFGLVDRKTASFCLQQANQLMLSGARALALAQRLTSRIAAWEAGGKASLADFRYRLPLDGAGKVSFRPAIFDRAHDVLRP